MTNVQNDPPHISLTPVGAPSTDELADAAGTLRMLVEQAPVAVIAYDLEGHVTEWNPAAERVLGWTREETIGRTPPHVSETNRLEFDSNQYRTIAQGGMAGFEIVRRCKDGATVILDCSNGVLRDRAGEVVGFVSMLKDVTADHQARTEIADLEAKLRHGDDEDLTPASSTPPGPSAAGRARRRRAPGSRSRPGCSAAARRSGRGGP